MILDYNQKHHQIRIQEESGEHFLHLQEGCSYNLCARFRNGKYEVPFISLPIVITRLHEIHYPITFTDKLKENYAAYGNIRKRLVELKERKYSTDDSDVIDILNFIKETEVTIKATFKKFYKKDFSFYGNQIETIIYGIIGERIVIGNDIGTGKTLASIMIAKYLIKKGLVKKALFMLPASLVKNFYNDYVTFFRDSEMLMVTTELPVKRETLYNHFRLVSSVKMLITNYEKCNFDFIHLEKLSFDMVVVDEFHKMKNFVSAKRSINFFNLIQVNWKPRFRFPMSGTPIENKLFDIYPVFKLIDDGKILGGEKFFDSNFVEYQDKEFKICLSNGKCYIKVEHVAVGFKNHKYVQNLIAPYIIKKKLDLPVKCYHKDVFIDPSKKFLEKYAEVKKAFTNGSARYVGARQFLCDTMRHDFPDNPKDELLEDIVTQTSSKVLIFTFFKAGVKAIERKMKQLGYECLTCMGGDGKDPLDVVNEFKNNPNIKGLITTDKINFGQNIQCAKIVIEWDKPIKPTITMQRAGRAYRSGQTEDVHVYSFVIRHTVEEIIQEQWELKRDVITKVIDSLGTDSSNESLEDIVSDMEANILKKFEKEM